MKASTLLGERTNDEKKGFVIMPNIVKLPGDWDEIGTERPIIREGEYAVVVEDVTLQEHDRISVVFKVLDEGEFCRWKIYERFPLAYEWGRCLFKEFLDVLGIDQRRGSIDLNLCKCRGLRVRVVHKAGKDGRIWANVAAHMRSAR